MIANDAKRIWEAAEFLHAHMHAAKKRTHPSNLDQRVLAQHSIAAQITRGLRAHNADMTEQAWEQRAAVRLPRTRHNYLAALQHDLSEQFPARYSLREGETREANARYARHLTSLRPQLKTALQRARYCVLIDSTCRSDLPIDNLMLEVMAITMPLARSPEMAEMVVAMFDPNLTGSLREPPPQRVVIANILDHMACEGLLTNLDVIMNDVKHPERAGDLLGIVADAMEIAIEILRGQLGASTLFVAPPGLLFWERNLQKFVFLLLEVCKARRMDFGICAPNLRVGAGDLRPAALSYLAYIASVSKAVQSVERCGNSQLTIDDAIFYDHGMMMGRLTFDQQGRRLTGEATATEREAVRRHNWLVRNNVEITVREELAEMAKQIGDWPAARAVERTIPQKRFALGSEPVKLPVGLRHIIATESTNLKAAVDACSITYAYWY